MLSKKLLKNDLYLFCKSSLRDTDKYLERQTATNGILIKRCFFLIKPNLWFLRQFKEAFINNRYCTQFRDSANKDKMSKKTFCCRNRLFDQVPIEKNPLFRALSLYLYRLKAEIGFDFLRVFLIVSLFSLLVPFKITTSTTVRFNSYIVHSSTGRDQWFNISLHLRESTTRNHAWQVNAG